ncbi:hypothetical protein KIN20_005867 [Parelaphostrongylus tenuis]|uniref:Uncharacterized protein n=1 Tax=Parelaphostrongylus tenuis TaxID=148309 RepID=A0AAD5M106_PARTN|nr:hypothetical protein KIN20_005867 [Parelaphostrongylus tenuis]
MFNSRELNGRKCNVTKFGFPNVETLFKAFPDYFYSQDGLWYGQVTEASEDVVRSMVTEKSKRKGWNPLKGINSKRARETAERCTREQRHSDADSRIGVQKKRLFPEMGSERGIEDREAPTQFDYILSREPSISRVLPFSSADGNLPDQSVYTKVLISEAPPGFENQQLLLENRSRLTPKAETKYKSFRDVVLCGASSPLYPPDITISAPQSQSRGHSLPTLLRRLSIVFTLLIKAV